MVPAVVPHLAALHTCLGWFTVLHWFQSSLLPHFCGEKRWEQVVYLGGLVYHTAEHYVLPLPSSSSTHLGRNTKEKKELLKQCRFCSLEEVKEGWELMKRKEHIDQYSCFACGRSSGPSEARTAVLCVERREGPQCHGQRVCVCVYVGGGVSH